MEDGGEPQHGPPGQNLLQVEQLLSCTQPSPHQREKTSGLSPCLLPDRDECEQPSTCRGQQCINTPGSYHCECKEGFAMGPRGQCEGKACCFLFPCPSNPPCAGLNTFFPHRSVFPPGREEGLAISVCPVPSLRAACPLLCWQEGQAFLGREKGVLPRSSPTFPGGSPTMSPCQLPILGGDAHPFSRHLDSEQTLVLASGLQGEQAAETQATCPHSIPLTWLGLGPSEPCEQSL